MDLSIREVGLARGAAVLLLEAGLPPPEPAFAWVAALGGEVLPTLAGFARWTERLGRRR